MGKQKLKEDLRVSQQGVSAIEQHILPLRTELFDTDRIIPKAQGGEYTDANTRALMPDEHQRRHQTRPRKRTAEEEHLKILTDARRQLVKANNSANNRLLAYERYVDILDPNTVQMLQETAKLTKTHKAKLDYQIKKAIESSQLPIVQSALGVKGVGAITIAYMLVYVDIDECEYASNLWAYAGLTKPSHERYTKNVAGGGNKTLRTILWTMADSMIKTKGVYEPIYRQTKTKLEKSKNLVKSYNTQGKLVEVMWKDTKPSHRHGAALRKVVKHFLADWWYVYRSILSMPTPDLYVKEHLGHSDIIKPEERGWVY